MKNKTQAHVNIDPETDFKLNVLANLLELKKTTLVKKAVEAYFNSNMPEKMEDAMIIKSLGGGKFRTRISLEEIKK